jgi:hypothetical protein
MSATNILAPFTAVRLSWAIAGKLASEPESKIFAESAEQDLKNMSTEAARDAKEQSYVTQSKAAIRAAVRSLEIIYKARKLNFDENEKLREAYIENVKDGIKFGSNIKDYLKALPAMAIAGPGVTGTLGPIFAAQIGIENNKTLFLWGFGAAMAGLGYLIHMLCVRMYRKRTQKLYIEQDYDRNLYYDHYITRVRAVLESLYKDIDRIHKQTFKAPYLIDDGNAVSVVSDLLKGVQPTMCNYVQKHMYEGVITPKLWTLCEVGEPHCKKCVYWKEK